MPIALAAVRLVRDARLKNRLIFRSERRLLREPPGLGRVECNLASQAEIDPEPLASEVGVHRIVEGLNRPNRIQQRRHRNRADRAPEKHGLFSLSSRLNQTLAAPSSSKCPRRCSQASSRRLGIAVAAQIAKNHTQPVAAAT